MTPVKPMLATSTQALPIGDQWSYEFKWDGIRALIDIRDRRPRLFSRAENDISAAYPELTSGAAQCGDALLDGEIVAFVDGQPSFGALQTRMHVRDSTEARRLAAQTPVSFVVFDLLRVAGVDLTGSPLSERRDRLAKWLAADTQAASWLTPSPVFDDGAATEATARAHHLEGVVAKRVSSKYRAGLRSPDWHKLRFVRTGDFVVLGWEAPTQGSRELSSLLVGYYELGQLVFAGKAGSGITGATASTLRTSLTKRESCPLQDVPPSSPGRSVTWVDPTLVVEIEFATWTHDRRLRHPVFLRVRSDKSAREAIGDA
jgi:bifunctional non-homologous end joining protein LigD